MFRSKSNLKMLSLILCLAVSSISTEQLEDFIIFETPTLKGTATTEISIKREKPKDMF